MELDACPVAPSRASNSWRPQGTQLGRLIENRIDEAYVLSWLGPLEIFVPVHDTGGYDRARTPFGAFDHRLEQIKGTASRFASHPNEVRITFDAPALHPHADLDLLFAAYDLPARDLTSPLWRVPSLSMEEVCTSYQCSACRRTHWEFVAHPSPSSRDRARRFQVAVEQLAPSRWPKLAPGFARESLSSVPAESGAFFERRFDADFLAAATGDEILLAPDPDLHGRDRLAFTKKTGRWASLAIKGTSVSQGSDLVVVNVRVATFRPHPRHFVLIEHFDRASMAFHRWSWLVPSTEFQRLATGRGPDLFFASSLHSTGNRWAPYRVPTEEVGARFVAALHARGSAFRAA